jgi:hypothetical protein
MAPIAAARTGYSIKMAMAPKSRSIASLRVAA